MTAKNNYSFLLFRCKSVRRSEAFHKLQVDQDFQFFPKELDEIPEEKLTDLRLYLNKKC